jgi:drug/metabolite transporter (DMT)-like permease
MPSRDLWRCAAVGIFGIAGSNYFYYLAIQRTNVATAIILQYTSPILVLLYMAIRGLQRTTLHRVASVVLAVAGAGLSIGIAGTGSMRLDGLGVVAGLAAALAFAWYNIGGGELLNKYDRWSVMMWALAGAAVFWQLLNPPWKPVAAQYSPAQWAFMAGFAICSVLLPFSFYFAGLQLLDPTRAIVGSCLEPVLSILIAAAALGETMGLLQGLGIVLVLAAIILAQIPERRREVLNKNVECPGRMPVYTCELVGHERQE